MSKNIIALILAVLTALLCVSCGGAPAAQPEAGSSSAEAQTEISIEADPVSVRIFDAKTNYFSLIRGDECSDAMVKTASALERTFRNRFKKSMTIATDFHPSWEEVSNDGKEILIGMTNRQASADFYARLPENGYGYTVTENKVVILGKDDTLTALAVNAFINALFLIQGQDPEALDLLVGEEQIYTNTKYAPTPSGIAKTGLTAVATLRDRMNIGQSEPFRTSQGAAFDGTYYYVILTKNVNGTETGVILKYDAAGKNRVAVSEEMALDHGNDMTWDAAKNELVITNMNGKLLTVVDPETLTVKRAFTADGLPGTPYAISYNAANDCYVILAGGKVNLVDREKFTVIRNFPMISMNYTGQGVDSDADCVYIPMSKAPDKGSNDNVVVVYNIQTGSVISQIHINNGMEIETMFNRDGVYYANFNSSGSTICRLDFGGYIS